MARPKTFDREEALAQAMRLFWEKGYETTTMTDLRVALGIGRQSLYDTFGDKKALFAEAFARYAGTNDDDVRRMTEHEDSLKAIEQLLESRVMMLSQTDRHGCLIVNSCIELSAGHPDFGTQVQAGLNALQSGFEEVLERAKQSGQLAPDAPATDLGLFLVTQVSGMVVMAKNGASRNDLQTIADLAMRAVRIHELNIPPQE